MATQIWYFPDNRKSLLRFCSPRLVNKVEDPAEAGPVFHFATISNRNGMKVASMRAVIGTKM
jgi:hypothetical protein